MISDIPLAFIVLKTHQINDPECNSIEKYIKNKTRNLSYFIKTEFVMYKSAEVILKYFYLCIR